MAVLRFYDVCAHSHRGAACQPGNGREQLASHVQRKHCAAHMLILTWQANYWGSDGKGLPREWVGGKGAKGFKGQGSQRQLVGIARSSATKYTA